MPYTGEDVQDHAGFAIAALGDFDGDGRDDVAVSAPEASTDLPAVGKVYVLTDADSAGGRLGAGLVLRGGSEWGRIGERLYGPQDLDGDGLGDLLVGSPYATPGGGVAAGWLAVVRGTSGGLATSVLSIDVQPGGSTTTADAGWVHEAGETFFGRAALSLPDSTGDGLPELVVGAPGASAVSGYAGGDHAAGDHPPGTIYAFASRSPEDVLATPVLSVDDAMGVIGGDTAGDALPWVLAAGPAGSIAAGAPEAADGAGLVTLFTSLAGEGLLAERDIVTLTGDAGALAGWALAGSRGELIDGNQLWVGEPGWDGGRGRLVALDPGTGGTGALAERAVAVLDGCWDDGQLGHDLGRGTLGPRGDSGDWYAVTAPWASVHAPRDGLVVLLEAATIADALGGDCGEIPDTSDAEYSPDIDGDGFPEDRDCDDGAAWRNPDAVEVCGDEIDDDCDGAVDETCGPADETGEARCGCGSPGPSGAVPVLLAVGFVGTRRRRLGPSSTPDRPTAQLPVRWQSGLPLVALALPGVAEAGELDPYAQAWLWGSATSEFLHGPVLTGDYDGDGAPDLAIANFQGTALYHTAGEVHLLPAASASGTVDLLNAPVQLMGAEEHDYFGVAIATVPGATDGLWVGADRTGLTNKVSGQAMLFLEPMGEPGLRTPAEADLLVTGDGDWDAMGRTIAVGDWDGDGLPDAAIGAPQRDGPTTDSPGRVWLLHAADGQSLGEQRISAVSSGELDGATPEAFLGWRLLAPGDLDGDGREDLLVGSLGQNPSKAGHLALFNDLDPTGGLTTEAAGTWAGVAAGDEAGHGLSAYDWDGDGTQEVLVGAPFHGQARGRVWLLDGYPQGVESMDDAALVILDGEVGDTLGHSVAAGPLLLLGLPGTDGVRGLESTGTEALHLTGPSDLGHDLGWLDDFDGDGFQEAVAVAPGADGTEVDQGVAVVLDGQALLDGGGGATTDLDFDGSPAGEDCDDADPRRTPDTPEICRNDLDDDCDQVIDETSCQRGGCSTVPGAGAALPLALLGLALVGLRRRGALLGLGLLIACGDTATELTLTVEEGPVAGEVPISLAGEVDTLILAIDGEAVASSDSGSLSWTWDTSQWADGDHVVRGSGYTGSDTPSEAWTVVTVDQSLADEHLPQVSFRSPLDGDELPRDSDVFISLMVSDDVCIDDVRVYRFGDSAHTHGLDELLAVLPPEGPWELYWEDAASGEWQLEAHVADCVGHTALASVDLTVSDDAPVSCTLVEPTDGSEVSGTVDVKVAASSDAGITSVSVTADGTLIDTDTSSPWGVTWEAGEEPRDVTLAAACTAADGAEAADTVVVSVVEESASDFEATLTRPQDGDTVSGDVTIRAAVGGGNGPANVDFYADDTLILSDTESPWEVTWDSTSWPDGATTLRIVGVEATTGVEAEDAIDVTVANGS